MKFKPMPFIRYFGRWYMLAMLLAGIAMQIIPFKLTYEEHGIFKYFAHIFFFALSGFYVYALHKELWDKFFATIYISAEEIVWKCPFRKTIHLPVDGCYMGVELENSHNKLDYEYIYFSKTPYPREKAHRINEIPCSDSFVKYRFSPKLAEYILKTLPKEQTKPLDYFYCKYKREHK